MRHLLCEATGPVVGRACDDLLTPAIAKLAAPSIATLAADPRPTSSGEEAPSGACYCLASFYTLLCEWAAQEGGDSEERAAQEAGDSALLGGEGGSGEQPGEQAEEEPVVQAEAAQPASAWEDEARLEEQTSPMATRAAGSREGSPSVERSGASSGGAELV